MNKSVSLWGRTHHCRDRRSGDGSFNWHIPLFLFWIGSQAWWKRKCLTWWSVDVKTAAVRLRARSIPAPLCSETNGCCQANKKSRPPRSCSQKPSLSLWFWLLAYKTPNGLYIREAVWQEVTCLPHFNADIDSTFTHLWFSFELENVSLRCVPCTCYSSSTLFHINVSGLFVHLRIANRGLNSSGSLARLLSVTTAVWWSLCSEFALRCWLVHKTAGLQNLAGRWYERANVTRS